MSFRVTVLLDYINLALDTYKLDTHWLLITFLSTTAKTFYDDYSTDQFSVNFSNWFAWQDENQQIFINEI